MKLQKLFCIFLGLIAIHCFRMSVKLQTMNKLIRFSFVIMFFMMTFSLSSFGQAVGDYITILNGAGPTWNWQGSLVGHETWGIVTQASPLIDSAVTTQPTSTTNAWIRTGHTVNVNASG